MGGKGKPNHRFKLSAMMPNAWFYKLTTITKTRSSHPAPHQYPTRPPGPVPNHDHLYPIPTTPRRSSSNKRPHRRTIYMPSPSTQFFNHFHDDDAPSEFDPHSIPGDLSWSSSSSSFMLSPAGTSKFSSSPTDIIIDVDQFSYTSIDVASDSDHDRPPQLPPILTRPITKHAFLENSSHDKILGQARARKSVSSRAGGGVRIRGNRAKLAGKKTERRETMMLCSDSFAMVKASLDPEKDFRESMVEMIVENNIRASKDLEHLLACYLSLNPNKYHGLIISAFEQIWFHIMPHPLF